MEELSRIAAESGVFLVMGVIERDGGTLYCTVLFFADDGAYLGKHRKLMPTASERLVWGFGDGSTLPVFNTPLGKLGAVICWENYMPLLRMAMYAKGIEIYCAPTADAREAWQATVRHIALEGRCFVLSANQFARRSDYPADHPLPGDDPDAVICSGGSVILAPLGEVLAGPLTDAEGILPRRPRPRSDRAWQVRLRRRRALRPTRRLLAHCRRVAAITSAARLGRPEWAPIIWPRQRGHLGVRAGPLAGRSAGRPQPPSQRSGSG